ncbi:MAG: hypothetical protein QM724_03490 [Flavobacteriales bacterium]
MSSNKQRTARLGLSRSAGRIGVAGCAMALLTYTVLRAWLTSFTWDESFTFIYHVLPRIFFQRSFDQMGANHHLLNVWGMIASHQLFGISELALRLPGLLAHVVYLYASARIALQARSSLLAVAAFLLMNVHPYLLDFFSLARGYGLANGWLMLCLWQATRYFTQGRRATHLVWATAAAVLAAMSNLIMLNFLLAIAAAVMAIWMIQAIRGQVGFPWRHALIMTGGVGLGLALLLPTAIGLAKGGSFFFGCGDLWDCMMGSFGSRLLYELPYGTPVLRIMGWALGITAGCCTVIVIAALRGKWTRLLLPMAFGALVLAACMGSILVQHHWLGMLYPRARTALFLLPMASFILASGLVAWPGRAVLPAAMAALLCVPLLINQWQSANLVYSAEWKPAGEVARMMALIRQDHAPFRPERPVITVASDIESRGSISYYAIRDSMPWAIPMPHDDPGPFLPNDYYIVESSSSDQVDTANWELIYHSAITGTDLYRDERWRNEPYVVHHEVLDLESPDVPGLTSEQHSSGRYSVRFDSRTRSTRSITWIVPDTLDGPELRLLGTAMIMQPGPLNWVTFIVRVTRGPAQVAYADANSAMQMQRFGEWQLVALPLNLLQPLLPGDEVHVEGIPLTDDTVMYMDDLGLWVLK